MTRLLNILILSVKDAKEWFVKTEARLKEEGKGFFSPLPENALAPKCI